MLLASIHRLHWALQGVPMYQPGWSARSRSAAYAIDSSWPGEALQPAFIPYYPQYRRHAYSLKITPGRLEDFHGPHEQLIIQQCPIYKTSPRQWFPDCCYNSSNPIVYRAVLS